MLFLLSVLCFFFHPIFLAFSGFRRGWVCCIATLLSPSPSPAFPPRAPTCDKGISSSAPAIPAAGGGRLSMGSNPPLYLDFLITLPIFPRLLLDSLFFGGDGRSLSDAADGSLSFFLFCQTSDSKAQRGDLCGAYVLSRRPRFPDGRVSKNLLFPTFQFPRSLPASRCAIVPSPEPFQPSNFGARLMIGRLSRSS